MKRMLIMLACAALLAAAMPGCSGNNAAITPSPALKPTAKPIQSAAVSPSANVLPSATAGAEQTAALPDADANGEIAGFKEGEKVDPNALPEKVLAAIKAEYASATITGAAYATYMDAQTYLITLSGADVDKLYIKADGTIIPADTPATQEP